MSGAPAVGLDVHPRGWVAVALSPDRPPQVAAAADVGALVDRFPAAEVIAVDMPIGLPATERACDMLAKAFVGPRRSSVFMTPPAEVLFAGSYPEANRRAAAVLGKGISRQAFGLARNIERVGRLAEEDDRVIEVHPEVSFRELAGEPVRWPKSSWNGQALRRRALEEGAGIVLPETLGEAGGVPVADVLDAAVAAWSARRYAAGEARALPEGAASGAREVIWY